MNACFIAYTSAFLVTARLTANQWCTWLWRLIWYNHPFFFRMISILILFFCVSISSSSAQTMLRGPCTPSHISPVTPTRCATKPTPMCLKLGISASKRITRVVPAQNPTTPTFLHPRWTFKCWIVPLMSFSFCSSVFGVTTAFDVAAWVVNWTIGENGN